MILKGGYSQTQKIISIILIFIILIEFSGCASTRTVSSVADLPRSGEYYYFVHVQNEKYELQDVLISDGILSGKINNDRFSKAGNKIHFYIASDTVVQISTEGMLYVHVNDISDIEVVKASSGKTTLLVLGSFLGLILLIGILSFDIEPFL